jgi:arylsulfatase A
MNTRVTLRSILALAALLLAAARSGAEVSPVRRPNVVLLLVDDLGYECLGANGGRTYRTPVVDRLAAEGMRFEQMFVQPNCTPTRVALMTGQVNARNYIHFGQLESTQRTFGHLFRDAGYTTAIVGKWQLGGSVADDTPRHFGFQEYCLYHIRGAPRDRRGAADGGDYASRYINPGLVINGEGRTWGNNAYAPDLCHAFALDWLGRQRDRPFFLYYPMMLTHAPFDPTPDSSDYPGKGGPVRTRQQHYADMIAYNDKLIGRLVARLEELQLRERTLIVFLGDNGTPGNFTTAMADGEVVQAGKGATIRAGMHVPLVVNWPGTVRPGGVCSDLVNVTDILPTICAAAGIQLPDGGAPDGISFLPQLHGERGRPREWIYSWFNPLMRRDSETVEMAFTREFKLYRTGEFHDWRTDPEETKPLRIAELSGEAAAAARLLQGVLDRHREARPPAIEAKARALRDTPADGAAPEAKAPRRRQRNK